MLSYMRAPPVRIKIRGEHAHMRRDGCTHLPFSQRSLGTLSGDPVVCYWLQCFDEARCFVNVCFGVHRGEGKRCGENVPVRVLLRRNIEKWGSRATRCSD